MRSLEQCKAEVFRRSEQKIKHRQKIQKTILTCCIPLVLCVVTVLGWHSMTGKSKDHTPEADAVIVDGAAGTVSDTLQIRSENQSYTISDSKKITQILYLLETPTTPEATPENFSNSSDFAYGSTEPELQTGTILEDNTEEIQLIFTTANGSVTQYSLKNHTLTELSTGNIRTLTDQQLEQLTQLLEQN